MAPEDPELAPAAILFVDDDQRDLLAVHAAFVGEHHELVLARSGSDALRLVLERDFAVIVLDVMMPDLDGFETARLIRTRDRNRHTPIIFATAHRHDDEKVREGYDLGAVDFLFKPMVPEILRAKVGVFVELHHRAERLRLLERRAHDRHLQEERQRWEAEALRTENARKDDFLAILSHELRNPLNALVLTLPFLRERAAVEPEIVRPIQAMERQVRHLTRLVDDLLDVGGISSGKIKLQPRRTTLASVVDHAIETAAPLLADRDHELILVRPEGAVPLIADSDRLTQIVCNLLSNSARYTDRGGQVDVSYGSEGGEAWVRVRDNGRGIAPAVLPHVFTLYVQEQATGIGLGLGLAVSRKLAELHGGTIEARSEGIGCGSTFELRMPHLVPEGEVVEVEALPREPSNEADRYRVLIVDDNDDVRYLTAKLLASRGLDVEEAACGADAVEQAAIRLPNVILLDLGMPGVDGYATATLLRERLGERTPPLVAVSGFGTVRDRQRTQAASFAAHLLKPVDPDHLMTTLAGLIAPTS